VGPAREREDGEWEKVAAADWAGNQGSATARRFDVPLVALRVRVRVFFVFLLFFYFFSKFEIYF
jgi:hypothetical protein